MQDKKLISISKNFQVSVNIAYDLHDKEKISAFIPTSESIDVIEEFFESANTPSTNRAHVLIGSYGRGKSHMVLEALNLLFEKDKKVFSRLLEKTKTMNPGLFEDMENYLESGRRILPVVISGSSTSLGQSFLQALENALKRNGLEKYMPDTHFKVAAQTIRNWKESFPETYEALSKKLNISAKSFTERLENFDSAAYEEFGRIYPELTSGSTFNPFAGCDIAELYESVSARLSEEGSGYSGIFIVYDEFSKYLESSIGKARLSDIKLLQDFAEKCCRTGGQGRGKQLHILLISHKDFANYIDTLPKEKVDGWKGVSERFKHMVLNSDYGQVYDVMAEIIKKDGIEWPIFEEKNKAFFEDLCEKKTVLKLFSNDKEEANAVARKCYPLSPFTSYMLPRLSEKIAQNERSMFTFLSGSEKLSLASIVDRTDFFGKTPPLFTPDILFDYFEKQLRGESYASPIKKVYSTAKKCLQALEGGEKKLERKIVKSLCLVYALDQTERLSPTTETLSDMFVFETTSHKDLDTAVENLCKANLLYKRRTNGFLSLKENTNENITELIQNTIERRKHKISEIEILNEANNEKYLYPVEYNTKMEMTRFFTFVFHGFSELKDAKSRVQLPKSGGDGLVIGIVPDFDGRSGRNIGLEKELAIAISKSAANSCIIVTELESADSFARDLRTLDAVKFLKAENGQDKILCDELSMIQEDIENAVQIFVQGYTRPENGENHCFLQGEEAKIYRRANLSAVLSKICSECYTLTPVVNNEPLNKNTLTGAADKSRKILVDAILDSDKANLGIEGGQELSFMRSSLCVPNILDTGATAKRFATSGKNLGKNFENLFSKLNGFIDRAKKEPVQFEEIIKELTGKEGKIAIRKGIVPIYLAVAFSKIKRNIVLKEKNSELQLSADTLCRLTCAPGSCTLEVVDFNDDKAIYVKSLYKLFDDRLVKEETDFDKVTYTALVSMMQNWQRSLTKYAREKQKGARREHREFMQSLKNSSCESQKFLFKTIPRIFNSEDFSGVLIQEIEKLKAEYESFMPSIEESLAKTTHRILSQRTKNANESDSLRSLYKRFTDELESINPDLMDHKFENNAERLFEAFENCGNDEHKIVNGLAPVLTGINIADWNDSTIDTFERRLEEFADTLVGYASSTAESGDGENSAEAPESSMKSGREKLYKVQFPDGEAANFGRIECSKKAQSLHSELKNILGEYGQSVSRGEKRQILLEVLKEVCL